MPPPGIPKVLYTYDPSIHDYSEDQPELVCIGHDHYVYGNKKEIEEYKAIRDKDVPIKSITIADPDSEKASAVQENTIPEEEIKIPPVHDTGRFLYKFLSFFLPILGLIAAAVFKHFNYIRNYKACKKGAIVGLIMEGLSAEGCTIQAERFEIVDYEPYLEEIGYTDDKPGRKPEKLALVTVILTCGEKPADIILPEFRIYGLDTLQTIGFDLVGPVNGFSEPVTAIHLEPEKSYRVTLPYPLYSYLFGGDTWKNMEDYTFWFQATSYFTEKNIRLN